VIALTLAFTLFTIWRLYRRRLGQTAEAREEFLAYPQTSPEIYAWLPYHRESAGHASADAAADTHAAAAPAPADGEPPTVGAVPPTA
jgi:hypothetical protein